MIGWLRSKGWRWLLAGVASLVLTGCPQHGMIDDGTSISYGPSNRGKLIKPVRLQRRGDGYWIPPRWAKRALNWGTDEMIAMIVHTGRTLQARSSGTPIGVADISRRRGGPSAWHRSHQTGRDVDLLFFARDGHGKPVKLQSMPHFDANGKAVLPSPDAAGGTPPEAPPPESVLTFDVERNWLLVRTLMQNPIARLQFIFVYDPLKQQLLDHARAIGEPDAVIEQASLLLHQPRGALPHDDHFHVRIYCDPTDRIVGCEDRGSLRWTKKAYKYGPSSPATTANAMLARALLAPLPAMMVLGVFPFLP